MAICLALASCTNVLWVKKKVDDGDNAKYSKIGGIPFYVKKEQFKQTTVYAKTWLKSTLTVEMRVAVPKVGMESAVEGATLSLEKDLFKQDSKKLLPIKLAIINAHNQDADDTREAIRMFESLPAITNETIDQMIPAKPLKNTVESEWIVDVNQQYYLNAPLPWFGSGNLTQKLNDDGTLSEVTSTPDTKLADGISSLIPFKEYLTGRFVKDGKSMTSDDTTKTIPPEALNKLRAMIPGFQIGRDKNELQVVYVLSLSIDEVGHEYTFTRVLESRANSPSPIPFDTEKETFSRTAIGGLTQSEARLNDGSTVAITGSIKFPKGWGTDKSAEPKSP